MFITPELFYKGYFSDYHKTKQLLFSNVLKNKKRYEKELFGKELPAENSDTFEKYIRSEIRQTYIHSIETLFELIFAFEPNDSVAKHENEIIYLLTYSDWASNYKKIKSISDGSISLDFLDKEIDVYGKKMPLIQYLFYPFINFQSSNFPKNISKQLAANFDAIKYGIKVISEDFSEREEYNSYKHALRVIPTTNKVMFYDASNFDINDLNKSKLLASWDTSNSISFLKKEKNPDKKVTIITRSFETERDLALTNFCSNLITNMIGIREASINKRDNPEKEIKVPFAFFNKQQLKKVNFNVAPIHFSISQTQI